MADNPAGKPLGARLILRRRLTPSQPVTGPQNPDKGPSRACFPAPVLALQHAMGGLPGISTDTWYACAIITLVGKIAPVRFDQLGPMSLFYEIDDGELYAYEKGNASGNMGYGNYLGKAARANRNQPLHRGSVFHSPELVYAYQVDMEPPMLQFAPGSFLHLEHSLLWYENGPENVETLQSMRRAIRERYAE